MASIERLQKLSVRFFYPKKPEEKSTTVSNLPEAEMWCCTTRMVCCKLWLWRGKPKPSAPMTRHSKESCWSRHIITLPVKSLARIRTGPWIQVSYPNYLMVTITKNHLLGRGPCRPSVTAFILCCPGADCGFRRGRRTWGLPGVSSAPSGALLPQELPSRPRAVRKAWSPGHISFWVSDEHTQSSATGRPLSGPHRMFSAWVANACAVPSPASSAPLSTAQQPAPAWAPAAAKAARLATGMQVTTAQLGRVEGSSVGNLFTLDYICNPLCLRLQRSRASTSGTLHKYPLSIAVGSSRVPNFVFTLVNSKSIGDHPAFHLSLFWAPSWPLLP